MSNWNKAIITKAFQVVQNENTDCIILEATDAYGMGIDNPDIKLVIQWDLPISFDSIIQRMGRAGRKRIQAMFILFTPKWTQVTGPEEVEERIKKRTDPINANALLSDTNWPKGNKRSRLNQEVTASNLSDNESVANSEPPDEFTDSSTDQLFELLNTKAETDSRSQKARKQASKSNAAKRANLPDKMFDYIHTAKC